MGLKNGLSDTFIYVGTFSIGLAMSLINKRIYRRILEKRERLDEIQPLPSNLADDLRKELMIDYIYNSNAIEGISLTLQETRDVITEFYHR